MGSRKRNILSIPSKSPLNNNSTEKLKNDIINKKTAAANTTLKRLSVLNNSSKNLQKSSASNSVDMEEIFRAVLEDASKATTTNRITKNNENFNNSKTIISGNNENSKCLSFQRKTTKSTTIANKSQINFKTRISKNSKSLAIPKSTSLNTVSDYKEEVSEKSTISDSLNEFQNFFENDIFAVENQNDFEKSIVSTNAISSDNSCSEYFVKKVNFFLIFKN